MIEIGWCEYCEAYVTPYERECPGDYNDPDHPKKPLARHQAHICEECEERPCFFSVNRFSEHVAEYHAEPS